MPRQQLHAADRLRCHALTAPDRETAQTATGGGQGGDSGGSSRVGTGGSGNGGDDRNKDQNDDDDELLSLSQVYPCFHGSLCCLGGAILYESNKHPLTRVFLTLMC